MIRQFFLAGGLTLSAASLAAPPVELRDIELDAAGASVPLALWDVVRQRVFPLTHPTRVVIDLRHTRLGRNVHLPQPGGVVAAIRTGPQRDGTLRVVLELNSPPAVHWYMRAKGSGHELLVEWGQPAHTAPV